MKIILIFLFFVLTQTITAQTFTEIPQVAPFDGVRQGSIAFSDINGDGNEDVLITGAKNVSGNERIAKLYTNDGMGNFTEKTGTPFDDVWQSSIAFSDVNGDGNEDVLITGENSSEELIAKLYINDGLGNFTEKMDTPFDGVLYSSIAFSDVNGDGNDDVLITGATEAFLSERIAKLYINDGIGNFTEEADTPFDDICFSSIAFSDVNGDGNDDVLITGANSSNELIAKLYINDGMGNFTEETGTPFDGVWSSSIAFSDINGDGNEDVLITGQNSSGEIITKLYTNNGLGNFTEKMDTPFEGISQSSIAFSDVNGDGNDDILIIGMNSSQGIIAKLYANDGIVSLKNDLKIGINHDFIIFPNPSNSLTIYIDYKAKEMDIATISVYNVDGVLLKQQKEFTTLGQQTMSIDIGSLFPGAYVIQLHSGERSGVAKFMVQ